MRMNLKSTLKCKMSAVGRKERRRRSRSQYEGLAAIMQQSVATPALGKLFAQPLSRDGRCGKIRKMKRTERHQ